MFFPENQPNYINVFVELPVGTNIAQTNKTTLAIKKAIDKVLDSPIDEGDTVSYYQVADIEIKDTIVTKTLLFHPL